MLSFLAGDTAQLTLEWKYLFQAVLLPSLLEGCGVGRDGVRAGSAGTGGTGIGDKHRGTTRERVLGVSSCFALCLKILEPDKMGLEGGFSRGFEFFQVF